MPIGLSIGLIAAALALGAVVGFLVRRLIAEKKIGSAEAEAKRILSDCAQQAEAMKKERLIEVKEEMLRLRNETEADLKERREEVKSVERRLTQKEENLDHKSETLDRNNEILEE